MRFTRSNLSILAVFAVVALSCIALVAILPARAQVSPPYLPSIKIGTAAFIAPGNGLNQADAFYGTSTTATDGLAAITGHATPVPPEITALANALKGPTPGTQTNPDLLYQYVRNNIENEWTYGESKGALGAMIDKSGTAFDQAALLVALLRSQGYTANIQLGTVSPSPSDFQAWTNITEAGAACQMLSSGGIPGVINGVTTSDCSYPAHTAITSISFMHAWVIVSIASSSCGTTCMFDPSFKPHNWKPGIARAATGITAGDPYNAATMGMTTGTQSGLPYVSGLNPSNNLYNLLATYSANYLAYIKANNLQGAQIEDIAGGGVIIPDYSSIRQTAPGTYTVSPNFPTPLAAIPDQFRSTLAVSATEYNNHTGLTQTLFDETFFADQIYGRRLSVSTNFNDGEITTVSQYATFNVYLKLDDQIPPLVTTPMTGMLWTEHPPATITMAANHPYAASADGTATTLGTYMDATVIKNVTLLTPLSLVHAWGGVGPGLLSKWSGERPFDNSAPFRIANYPGCETCNPLYTSSTGDFQREKAQAAYLAQYTRAAHIHAGIANGIVQLHHVLGVVYADDLMDDTSVQTYPGLPDYFVADTYARFDIDAGFSFTNRTSDPVARRAAVQSIAATASAIEGSIMGQLADVPDTSSTATRFEWANAPPCPDTTNPTTCEDPASAGGAAGLPRKIFNFAPSTAVPTGWALWEKQVTPPASGSTEDGNPQIYGGYFQTALAQDVGLYATGGFTVTAPQEIFLGPGQRGGYVKPETSGLHPVYGANFTKQRGPALIATKYDANYNPTEIAHDVLGLLVPSGDVATLVPAKGGGGGAQPNGGATYNPADAADVLKSKFVDRSNLLGVDLKTGAMSETSPASIETGNGGFPYALSASFDWKAGPPPSDPQTGPIPPGQPNPGWVPNWYNSLNTSGSGMEGMGASDIRGAAAAIAAFVAEQDIYVSTDPLISTTGPSRPFAQRDTAVALTQAWWAHQLSDNVATVSVGKSARQFVRLPDNTWFEPGPGYATMVQTGSRIISQALCPIPRVGAAHYALSRGWDYNPITSYAVTNAHGDVENFGFWVSHYSPYPPAPYCPRQSGFRLNSWTFPQGVTVTPTYAATTDSDDHMLNAPTGPFASSSQPLGVTNSLGRSLAYTFDMYGIFTGVKDGTRTLGVSSLNVIAAPGHTSTTTMTDPTGAVTSFGFVGGPAVDSMHRPVPYPQMTSITTADNPSNPNIEYAYDPLGEVNAVYDAVAVLHPTTRGPYVFLIGDGTRGERDDPLGGAYAVTFDTYGHASRYQDELNRLTQVKIDSRSRPSQYTYPEGDQEFFGYDDHNNMASYIKTGTTASCTPTCPTPLSASATYDPTWNKPLTVTNFKSLTTTITYYNSGAGTSLLHTATRPLDNHGVAPVYSFTYDAAGKPLTASFPFTSGQFIVTKNTFDSAENLSTSIDDFGTGHVNATMSYGYDTYGNVTSTTDPRGAVTISSYDPDRRKLEDDHHDGASSAPLNAAAKIQYDIIGRDIEDDVAKCFDNATTCPNEGTNVVTWVAAKKTAYTPTSKIYTVTDADSRVITSSYDGDDRLLTVTDPISRMTHYVYDAAGQKLVELHGWAGSNNNCAVSGTLQECYATSTYGQDGEKLTEMDANGALAATQYYTSYAYDGFLRLSKTTFPDNSTEQVTSYDANGNILTHVNRAGQSETFTYDNLDRILTKLMPAVMGVNPAVTTSYDYYLNNTPYTLTDTNGNAITFNYDTAGRKVGSSTTIPGITGAQVTSYTLDQSGNRTALIWPDNYCVAYGFDLLNRMLTATEGAASGGICTAGSTVLATYTYDAMSRRAGLAYPNATTAYTYTNAGDLLTLNHDSSAGGLPHFTMTYTNAHELLTEAASVTGYLWAPASAATDTYTPANNLNQYPSWTPQGSTLKSFTYDGNGNLTGAVIGAGTWTYAYDPENHLINAHETAGGTINATYGYDPLGHRNAKAGSGGVVNNHYLDDGDDEITEYNAAGSPTVRYIPGPAINEPIGSISVSTGSHRFFQTDHHGSVISVVSSGGTQVEGPFSYDAYGNSQAPSTTEYRYVGMRLDAETGLYYDRARMYSPALGRLLQVDPIGYEADLNLYSYAGNNPSNNSDPNGLCSGSRINAASDSACADTKDPDHPNAGAGSPKNMVTHPLHVGKGLWIGQIAVPMEGDVPVENDSRDDAEPGIGHNGGPGVDNGLGDITAVTGSDPFAPPPATPLSQIYPDLPYLPANRGATPGTERPVTLNYPQVIDRFGEPSGSFASPLNTPFWARGLPLDAANRPYHQYRVMRPVRTLESRAAEAFGSKGGGIQYDFGRTTIQDLVNEGVLKVIK